MAPISDREAYLLAHRRPTGRLGRQVAESMNSHHRPLREWGLKLGKFPEQARILEAACGGGMTARTLLREMEILTPKKYRERLASAGLEDVRIALHPEHPWIAMTAVRPGMM